MKLYWIGIGGLIVFGVYWMYEALWLAENFPNGAKW